MCKNRQESDTLYKEQRFKSDIHFLIGIQNGTFCSLVVVKALWCSRTNRDFIVNLNIATKIWVIKWNFVWITVDLFQRQKIYKHCTKSNINIWNYSFCKLGFWLTVKGIQSVKERPHCPKKGGFRGIFLFISVHHLVKEDFKFLFSFLFRYVKIVFLFNFFS